MSYHIAEGGCTCGKVIYRIYREPLIVHACHCRQCQQQSGSTHALNALIEHRELEIVSGEVASSKVPTQSGAGQTITRCCQCLTALWSHYHRFPRGRAGLVSFIRVGTLHHAARYPPDVHIYTDTMLSQSMPAPDIPRFEAYYDLKKVWSAESLSRL